MTVSGARPPRSSRWITGPLLWCVLASVLCALPVGVAEWRLPEPVFGLVPAFAWAAIRPSIPPPFALVALGLFGDLLWGSPLGLWPLCLLSAYAFTLSVRASLSGESFLALWAWYAAACGVAFGAGVLLTRLTSGVTPNLVGVGWQWLISAALFPLARRLIDRYDRADGGWR